MHNYVIQLSSKPVSDKGMHDENYTEPMHKWNIEDDNYLDSRCDYIGDKIPFEQIADMIGKDFKKVATLNVAKRTLTFKKPETLKRKLNTYARGVLAQYTGAKKDDKEPMLLCFKTLPFWKMLKKLNNPLGVDCIIYCDDCYCESPGRFLNDYAEHGGNERIFHIGTIMDFHC